METRTHAATGGLRLVPLEPEHVFDVPAGLDADGFPDDYSYAEKAEIERAILLEIRRTTNESYTQMVAAEAYMDDLRERIARFEALSQAAPFQQREAA
jgi:hypothetical protein